MWPILLIGVSSFLVGLSGALMPGPVLTVTVTEAIRRGFWAGPLVVMGHGLIEFPIFLALAFGIGALWKDDLVFAICGGIGALVLIWMGVGMVRGSRGASFQLAANEEAGTKPLIAGILTSISNPYFIIWWGTIGVSYIAISQQQGVMGLGAFYTGHIMADLLWYGSIALAITLGKRIMDDRTYRWIIAICGIFLVGLGVYFGTSGVKVLLR